MTAEHPKDGHVYKSLEDGVHWSFVARWKHPSHQAYHVSWTGEYAIVQVYGNFKNELRFIDLSKWDELFVLAWEPAKVCEFCGFTRMKPCLVRHTCPNLTAGFQGLAGTGDLGVTSPSASERDGGVVANLLEERKARALEIWKASGSQSNKNLADSLLGDVLAVALSDFAVTYKCARGHQIDSIYVTALRHDVLIAIEAAATAGGVRNGLFDDEERP